MNAKYEGKPVEFLGLYVDENDDTCAVIRMPKFGLYLKLVHPSCVELAPGAAEPSCPKCGGALDEMGGFEWTCIACYKKANP